MNQAIPTAAVLQQAAEQIRRDHPAEPFWTAVAEYLEQFAATKFGIEEPGMITSWDRSHVLVDAIAKAYLAGGGEST